MLERCHDCRPRHPNEFGLSEEYWERLSSKERALYAQIRPLRRAVYQVQNHLARIEDTLEGLDREDREMGGAFELCPDFQRGHVWDRPQQVAYIGGGTDADSPACRSAAGVRRRRAACRANAAFSPPQPGEGTTLEGCKAIDAPSPPCGQVRASRG